MNSLLQTLQFLTVIPLGRAARADNLQLQVKTEYFPVVGLVVGLIIAAAGALFFSLLPPLVAGACTIISLVFLTGGLHLDGLADTADGFFSARPREEILAIMRDSRTGAFGVVAVVCILILKIAAAASLSDDVQTPALILMPLLGRCSMGLMLHILPPARPDGMAASIRPGVKKRSLIWAMGVPLLAGWLLWGMSGVLMSLVSLLAVIPLSLMAWRKIGGMTGDVLGAACEVVEAAAIVTAAGIGFAGGM